MMYNVGDRIKIVPQLPSIEYSLCREKYLNCVATVVSKGVDNSPFRYGETYYTLDIDCGLLKWYEELIVQKKKDIIPVNDKVDVLICSSSPTLEERIREITVVEVNL